MTKKKVVLLIFAAAITLSFQSTYLQVSGERGSCIIPSSDFSVSFVHSVELSKEIDFYRVCETSLFLYKTLVKSAGWGLPSTEKNFSIVRYKGDEWFEYRIKRHVDVLRISTSPVNRFTLESDNLNISLEKFGDFVEIRVVKKNPLMAMFHRWCDG
ncbi:MULTISPECIES: DUF1850 domain-containing protein [unclassified Archaeoglobus]|jgi:hypothetical protein|uniref:DUF1850 domain-containing protein n=1 Tax=unclassified Archaeoglobus TaxID=2643606 RepID=UPI0025C14822|nr:MULTISPECIES: DUF1850 domain-containing protein [unclassified Archaeoglobus]